MDKAQCESVSSGEWWSPAKSSTVLDLGHNPVRAGAQKAKRCIKGHDSSLSGLHWGPQPGSGYAPQFSVNLKAFPAACCQGKMATAEHSTQVIWKNRRWLFFISLLRVVHHYYWKRERGCCMSSARATYKCKPKFKPAMSTEFRGAPLCRHDQEASTFLAGSNKFLSAKIITHWAYVPLSWVLNMQDPQMACGCHYNDHLGVYSFSLISALKSKQDKRD